MKSLGVKCSMAFDYEQRGIRNGALAALLVTLAAFALAISFPLPFAEVSHFSDSKAVLAIIAAMLVGSLAVAIMNVANQRFFEPLDRNAAAAGTSTERIAQLQAILRNTHEQVTIAALVYFTAFMLLPVGWTDTIFVASMLFAIGILYFTKGYSKGAAARAFGFGLTFYPSIVLAALSLVAAFL